jgi:excisionase family DNA binding protein
MKHDEKRPQVDTKLATVDELAELTGLTTSYIRRRARQGLPGATQTASGKWLIPASAVDDLRRRPIAASPTVAAAGWEIERSLLYAERTDLQLRLQDSEIKALQEDNDRLTRDLADQRRINAVLGRTIQQLTGSPRILGDD